MKRKLKFNQIESISSITEYFYEVSKCYTDEIAVNQEKMDTLVSYQQLYEDSLYVAGELKERNFKNEKIVISGDFSYQWIVSFFGILLSHNVVVPINPGLINEETEKLYKFVDAVTMIQLASIHRKKEATLSPDIDVLSESKLIEIVKRKKNGIRYEKAIPDELAMLLFTSGTTGEPKCVMLSHKNIICDMKGAMLTANLGEDMYFSNVVPVLPPFHMFQITAGFLGSMFFGVTYCIHAKATPIECFKMYKPRCLFAVPVILESTYKRIMGSKRKRYGVTMLLYLNKIAHFFQIDIRFILFHNIYKIFGNKMKYVIIGGATCDTKVVRFFNEIGITVLVGYGTTECSPIISCNTVGKVKYGSSGLKLPKQYVSIRIIENEICVLGDIVMKGYYKNRDATSRVLKNGWYYTGDLGFIDKEGYLYITGRKDNLITLSDGNSILPEEIENSLKEFEQVSEVIVYHYKKENNDRLGALIYPDENYYGDISMEMKEENIKEIIRKYNKSCLNHLYIGHIEVLDKPFQKNLLGKENRCKYTVKEEIDGESQKGKG